eukprot:4142619-Lingulodinium_polyedra.AAC.1
MALLEHLSVVTGALHQCDWGAGYAKPTRLLGRTAGLEDRIRLGLPVFDTGDNYVGPLPRAPRK